MLQYASYGGLAIAMCELGLTLRGEIKDIWSNSGRFRLVRFLYLFSRYFALAAHIVNCCLATIVVRHPGTHTEKICKYSLVYRAVVAFTMLGVLDVILMIRVYALYNRPISMAIFFVFLLVGKLLSAIVTAWIGFPHLRFSPSCLVVAKPQLPTLFFAVGELILQLVIIGLTVFRHVSAARGGWSTPLVSLVSRQGSMVFAAITVAMVAALTATLRPVDVTHIVFPALIIVMSTSGCQLIINMQRLPQGAEDPAPVFTTTGIWSDTAISFSHPERNSGSDSPTLELSPRPSEISTVKLNNMDSTT